MMPSTNPHSGATPPTPLFPAGAPSASSQVGVPAGPSFNCPEMRHGGGATGDIRPAAISAPVHSGEEAGSSFGIGFPETRGSQHLIIVRGRRLGKAGCADNDPHGSSPSASLHGLHREDGREAFPWATNEFPDPEQIYPMTGA